MYRYAGARFYKAALCVVNLLPGHAWVIVVRWTELVCVTLG